MVLVVFSKMNSQAQKKALKVETVMEEESASYERVHVYIQPKSLCKDRTKYIAIRIATRMVTSSV